MKEITLRKIHRTMGVILAVFIILQAGTGFIFAVGALLKSFDKVEKENTEQVQAKDTDDDDDGIKENSGKGSNNDDDSSSKEKALSFEDILRFIHMKGGPAGAVYRIILCSGLLGMVFSGFIIFLKIQGRTKK